MLKLVAKVFKATAVYSSTEREKMVITSKRMENITANRNFIMNKMKILVLKSSVSNKWMERLEGKVTEPEDRDIQILIHNVKCPGFKPLPLLLLSIPFPTSIYTVTFN